MPGCSTLLRRAQYAKGIEPPERVSMGLQQRGSVGNKSCNSSIQTSGREIIDGSCAPLTLSFRPEKPSGKRRERQPIHLKAGTVNLFTQRLRQLLSRARLRDFWNNRR